MTRLLLLILTVTLAAGCEPSGSGTKTTTITTTQPADEKKDVHVRTPGVNVDVHRKGDKSVDVDVQRKNQ